jgi:hypothetical protein
MTKLFLKKTTIYFNVMKKKEITLICNSQLMEHEKIYTDKIYL